MEQREARADGCCDIGRDDQRQPLSDRKQRDDAADFLNGVVDLKTDRWFTAVLREESIMEVRCVSRRNNNSVFMDLEYFRKRENFLYFS